MISAWHLLWIIPLAASAGAFCMALMAVNRKQNKAPSFGVVLHS